MSAAPTVEHGVFFGSAGEGRISSASREDYAEAAAAVLADRSLETRILELAGDDAYTLTQFAGRDQGDFRPTGGLQGPAGS